MKNVLLLIILLMSAGQLAAQTKQDEPGTLFFVQFGQRLLKDRSVEIIFSYVNTSKEEKTIWLNPPGHEDAYYIQGRYGRYKLTKVTGVGTKAGETMIPPNGSLIFKAKFEEMPLSEPNIIDLIEGQSGKRNFYKVNIMNSK